MDLHSATNTNSGLDDTRNIARILQRLARDHRKDPKCLSSVHINDGVFEDVSVKWLNPRTKVGLSCATLRDPTIPVRFDGVAGGESKAATQEGPQEGQLGGEQGGERAGRLKGRG